MKKELYFLGLFILVIFSISIISAEEVCEEIWECGSWSECDIEGIKTKICDEIHNCNTTVYEPDLEKACGENCTKEQTCEEWNDCINEKRTRICYNTNTCGAAEERVIDWEACSETEVVDLTTNDAIIDNESEEGEEIQEDLDGCDGCLLEKKCYKHGERFEYGNKSRYCDPFDSKVKSQKLRNIQGILVSCSENYECQDNVCSRDGKCVDLEEILDELKEKSSFMSKFTCRFSSFFKIKSYNACLYGKLE